MKRNAIILGVSIFFMLITSNIILNVWFNSFDKYKFVEEWYKGILYLVGSVFLINYGVKKISFYKNEIVLTDFCSVQLSCISSILEALKQEDVNGFMSSIDFFSLQCSMISADSPVKQYINTSYCQNLLKSIQRFLNQRNNFCFSSIYHKTALKQLEKQCIDYKRFLTLLRENKYSQGQLKTLSPKASSFAEGANNS